MAEIKPFAAVRPAADRAARVLALPYDVMDRAEAVQMAEGNPDSFLHISRSEIDLPEETDCYSDLVYRKAAENLDAFLERGVLRQDPQPAYYLYQQEMDGRVQTGVVACVNIEEYEHGGVRRHELTRHDKEEDRIRHFGACQAHTEPVFLTYRNEAQVDALTAAWIADHAPCCDLTDAMGVRHRLWVVDAAETIERITSLFAAVPVTYIADGHHRSVSAYRIGKARSAAHPDETECRYFMAVLFPAGDLHLMDYNRVVQDLNGNTPAQLLEKIRQAGFSVTDQGSAPWRPDACHTFSMYLSGHWYALRLDPALVPSGTVQALDVSILQDRVLAPILGITDPRRDTRIDFVGGIRGLKELVRRAETDMEVAFALYPVSIETLMEIADQDAIMPPKSTWFEPKLGSGLFIHRF